jgi:hypothetical protein
MGCVLLIADMDLKLPSANPMCLRQEGSPGQKKTGA